MHPDPDLAGVGVAVFGSSEPAPGEPLYRTAVEVGALVARARGIVVTGGYGGVMEAASRGAREAGGSTIGVTCAAFGSREPNRWLVEARSTADLHDRQRELITSSRGFIVLPGGAGTLSELTLLWALERAGCLGPRPVVVLGDVWDRLFRCLERDRFLEPAELHATRVTRTPREAVTALADRLRERHGPGTTEEP
jgi:uncharacterized protein (TIGR00730 family)